MPILVRPYDPVGPAGAPDDAATLAVFRRAVHVTAAADYTPEQLAAWAPDDPDLAAWAARRAAGRTVVATLDGRVVGFTDVDADGYVDMMFVDPDAARRGVGRALLAWAHDEAVRLGATSMTTRASLTARPFFEAQGFRVESEHQPVVRGVRLTNFAMRRPLP